jgi:hypothetical protein
MAPAVRGITDMVDVFGSSHFQSPTWLEKKQRLTYSDLIDDFHDKSF